MRTVKCDRCGVTYDLSDEDNADEIRQKLIYFIVGSSRAKDEPEQRVEQNIGADLCLRCQDDLWAVYETALLKARAHVDKWIKGELSDEDS